jgi:glycosyltransferase involved in cell wall biosynthesis
MSCPVPADLLTHGGRTVTIIVVSRLAYRKGVDLLVATAPRICAAFPNVRFVVGVCLVLSSDVSLRHGTTQAVTDPK